MKKEMSVPFSQLYQYGLREYFVNVRLYNRISFQFLYPGNVSYSLPVIMLPTGYT